ncbi:MAG: serine hydrolase [Chloroflexi bacterium]|nr:serine hydrolase [Chloroflexota bacterium]
MRIDRRLTSGPPPVRPRRPPVRLPLGGFGLWLALSGASLAAALLVLTLHVVLFATGRAGLPRGLVVAGVPVGGLSRAEAERRLDRAYGSPVTLDYGGSPIQLDPAQLNFYLDKDGMMAAVTDSPSTGSALAAFWDYLWGRVPLPPAPVPLQANYDQSRLDAFVADVAARYDDPGTPARADPDTLSFIPGSAGYKLNRDAAYAQINTALRSPTQRSVTLTINHFEQAPPTYDTLADLLRTDVQLFQFGGTVSIFVADLRSGDTINMALRDGRPVDVGQGISYSGMSTIKIPVMVTFFRYQDGPPTPDEQLLLDGIFGESANAYTDLLLGIMGQGSGLIGTNLVSDTMAELGLPNTYLAGLLDTLGAITTPRNTPGNTRADIDLSPDRYNQTAAPDMGKLLVMIYDCSQGGGKLMETLPGQFTAEECQKMIDLLKENAVGPIFIAGGSPGAVVAHKHGWDLLPLNNVGDAALVFSQGGDYAMTVYIHRDDPVPFDEANRLIISLATGVFNYYNRK